MSTVTSANESQAILKRVYRAFFSPGRYEVKPTEQEVLDWGNNIRLPFGGGELAVTTWGNWDRPAVLLMHGWGGTRAQMTGFVNPLLFAGYRVVAYDQPAHGESDGKLTNLLEIAPSMDLIAQREGPFHAIIAHSFGTLITSYALVKRGFPPPARLVYLGAFNRLMDSVPRFQALAKLPDEIIAGLRAMIYENFGQEVAESITNEKLTPQIDIAALMFHAVTDNVTPIEDSRAIARVWERAHLFELDGSLGHRGPLQSGPIHEQVVKFLKHAM
ncbi:MAG TPA: alpha/beta fold hydrolase [Anaerolineales bacterium]|nr:alpha/beta fold hydrolase [Anaerolineales bacterium]